MLFRITKRSFILKLDCILVSREAWKEMQRLNKGEVYTMELRNTQIKFSYYFGSKWQFFMSSIYSLIFINFSKKKPFKLNNLRKMFFYFCLNTICCHTLSACEHTHLQRLRNYEVCAKGLISYFCMHSLQYSIRGDGW